MKKKYLVSVPVMAKVEVYVEAENEDEAIEQAYFQASNNKDDMNSNTVEPIYYKDKIEKIQSELLWFFVKEGYQKWDCKEEFGE